MAAAQITTYRIEARLPVALRQPTAGVCTDTEQHSFTSSNLACRGLVMLAHAFHSGSIQGGSIILYLRVLCDGSLAQTLHVWCNTACCYAATACKGCPCPFENWNRSPICHGMHKNPTITLASMHKRGWWRGWQGLKNKQQRTAYLVSKSSV